MTTNTLPTDLTQLPATIGDPTLVDPNATAVVAQTPEQVELAALKAQMAADKTEQAARDLRNQQMIDQLMQQRTPAPAAPAAAVPLNFDGLPDAVENPGEFKAGLTQRLEAREQTMRGDILSQVSRAAALDNLWNTFRTDHAELSKRSALVQGATAIEFQALQARGVDPATFAAQNPQQLAANIAARMNAELGVAPAGGAQPGGGVARTAGIAGGSTGGAAPTPPAPKPRGFNDQIKDAQKALGLY